MCGISVASWLRCVVVGFRGRVFSFLPLLLSSFSLSAPSSFFLLPSPAPLHRLLLPLVFFLSFSLASLNTRWVTGSVSLSVRPRSRP